MAKTLDDAEKEAINAYLRSKLAFWGTLAGVANVSVLLASLGYIFFLLPKYASEQARIHIIDELKADIDQVKTAVREASNQSAVERDRTTYIKKQNDDLTGTVKEVVEKTGAIKALLADQGNEKILAASKLIDKLGAATGETQDVIKKLGVVDDSTKQIRREIYGDLALLVKHQDLPKNVSPEGYDSAMKRLFQDFHHLAGDQKCLVTIPTGEAAGDKMGFLEIFPVSLMNSFEVKSKQ